MAIDPEKYEAAKLRAICVTLLAGALAIATYASLSPANRARAKNIRSIENELIQDGFEDPYVEWSRLYARVTLADECQVVVGLDVEGGRKLSKDEYDEVKDVSYTLKLIIPDSPNYTVAFDDRQDLEPIIPLLCGRPEGVQVN